MNIDALVLGTVNAPYRRSISADDLARAILDPSNTPWIVHLATFYTDVRPAMILQFAEAHGIDRIYVAMSYMTVRAATGERSAALEAKLGI